LSNTEVQPYKENERAVVLRAVATLNTTVSELLSTIAPGSVVTRRELEAAIMACSDVSEQLQRLWRDLG
jgi:hypothetical protein